MELGPIWRAILRNKSSYALIALQIAVTMAIMVNAIAIIQERTSNMGRESGIDEDNIVTLTSISFATDIDMRIMIDEDLAMLRAMPGVLDAIATNSFPLRGGGSSSGLATEPGPDADGIGAAMYFSDEHAVDAYGTNIIDGRNFAPDEITWNDTESSDWPPTGVITEALAKELFPDEQGSYVGKTVYMNDNDPVKIIGILDKLQAPWDGWERVENSMLVPLRLDGENVKYVVRTEPGQLNILIPQIEDAMAKNKDRIIENVQTVHRHSVDCYNRSRDCWVG